MHIIRIIAVWRSRWPTMSNNEHPLHLRTLKIERDYCMSGVTAPLSWLCGALRKLPDVPAKEAKTTVCVLGVSRDTLLSPKSSLLCRVLSVRLRPTLLSVWLLVQLFDCLSRCSTVGHVWQAYMPTCLLQYSVPPPRQCLHVCYQYATSSLLHVNMCVLQIIYKHDWCWMCMSTECFVLVHGLVGESWLPRVCLRRGQKRWSTCTANSWFTGT